MKPAGMVHALEEIHRLLKPGGTLIDIHPALIVSQIEVYAGGKVLFAQPKPDTSWEGYRQADLALDQVVQRRLYALERREQFDFLIYGSSVGGLLNFLAELGAYDASPEDEAVVARKKELFERAEEVMQAAGEGAEVATHEVSLISRLRPLG